MYVCGVLFMVEIVGRAVANVFRIWWLVRSCFSIRIVIDIASSKA